MTNTYAQLPVGQNWDYTQGDAVSMAVTIDVEGEEGPWDLDAEPVTAGIVGAAQSIAVEVVDDPESTVRLTPSSDLPPGRYGWWAKWRDRTFLAGYLNVRRRDSPGGSSPHDLSVTVDYVTYNVAVTIQNAGIPGPPGEGGGEGGGSVPDGGTTGQALVKASNANGDADWENIVNSVNGKTGTASLDASDVGAEPAGAIASALTSYLTTSAAASSYQPLDADLTALASAGNSTVLAATTASFTTTLESKLNGIEASADVTDATNVAAAGAVMSSNAGDGPQITSIACYTVSGYAGLGATNANRFYVIVEDD